MGYMLSLSLQTEPPMLYALPLKIDLCHDISPPPPLIITLINTLLITDLITMYAFVQNVGLGVNRTTVPHSGLQSVCAAPQHETTVSTKLMHGRNTSTVQMSWASNYSITLQTLVYNPTPVISGLEDKDLICNNVWKQVFGNAYVMESERAETYIAESSFRAGDISLREFVRAVALSSTYRRRFFECCGPYRTVELNFKHLLGRGPNSQEELSKHVQIIANEGFEAEINSYIDSHEYDAEFGNDYVPAMRFKGTYPTNEEFNRMCTMYSSPGTTDKNLTLRAKALGISNPNFVLSLDGAGVSSRLIGSITTAGNSSAINIKKAIPSRPDLDLGVSTIGGGDDIINAKASVVNRVEIVPGNYMYLTDEEASHYAMDSLQEDKVVALAEAEISAAKIQISLLESKVAELSLIN